MDLDKREELRMEELKERQNEPYHTWKSDNSTTLENDFIKTFPPEEQPLDDESPDFIDANCDEFNSFCEEVFNK